MKTHSIFAASMALAFTLWTATVLAEDGGVLVASAKSPAITLTAAEIRKAYLGVPIMVNGETMRPLRNTSDPALEEAFLQKVLFMSRDAYERLLLTRTMRGNAIPDNYDSEQKLANALLSNRAAISYMWEGKAGKPGIKIIAKLWQASN